MKKQLFPYRENSRARKTAFFLAETKPGRKKRARNLESRVRFGKLRFSYRKSGSKLTRWAATCTYRCPPGSHISYERAREDSRRKILSGAKSAREAASSRETCPQASGRCSGDSGEERNSQRLVWGRLPAEEGLSLSAARLGVPSIADACGERAGLGPEEGEPGPRVAFRAAGTWGAGAGGQRGVLPGRGRPWAGNYALYG